MKSEMALQRSGSASIASLLSRKRNLISNATRSASREAAGVACSTVKASFEAQAKVPTQHSSYIVRSSTKNQHIERFCGDVFFAGTHVFYYTFQSMEEAGILDRNNYLHLLVLHFIFLPRIYRAIDSFNTTAWNQHPIRTERNSRTLMHEDLEQWDD